MQPKGNPKGEVSDRVTGVPPEFVDWRVDTAARTAEVFEGNPIGTPIYLTSATRSPQHNFLSFITPSATALALKVAIDASLEAEKNKKLLSLQDVFAGNEIGKAVEHSDTPKLYDIFASCMVAVTFSFQALEVFCNSTIGRRMNGTHTVKHKGLYLALNAASVERRLSTDDKLADVLPSILLVKSPKGTSVWQKFRDLKDARDDAVHLKSEDAYSNANNFDRESLFFHFLNNDVTKYPRIAIEVVQYYFPQNRPSWLEEAAKFANVFATD